MLASAEDRTRVSRFVEDRIEELKGSKLQREIAREAGFPNPNILTMLKKGETKLALDRVPGLAKALEVDPAFLFRLAVEQFYSEDTVRMLLSFMGEALTRNEKRILETIRAASKGKDPTVTKETEAALTALFSQ